MQRLYPRAMVAETIVGGPYVRYIPADGTIFMVIEQVEEQEFVRAICPRLIWHSWGCFTVGAFRRRGCSETDNYWVEKIEEIMVTDTMTLYQVPLVAWMQNWRDQNMGEQTKPIPPSPPPS